MRLSVPSGADTGDAGGDPLYFGIDRASPKGVMLSACQFMARSHKSVAHYLQVESRGSRTRRAAAVVSIMARTSSFRPGQRGLAVVPLDYLTARDVVKAVERFGATSLAGVPPLWVQLLEAEWPAETAASKLQAADQFGRGADAAEWSTGAARAVPAGAAIYRDVWADRGVSFDLSRSRRWWMRIPIRSGGAIPFARDRRLIGPDGTRAAPGEQGELVHAGPLVAQGYWRDEERTAQRFRPAPDFATSGGMAVWSGDTVRRG